MLEGAAAKAATFGLHVYEVSARTAAFFAIYLVQLRIRRQKPTAEVFFLTLRDFCGWI